LHPPTGHTHAQSPCNPRHLGADDLDLEPVDVDFGRLDFEISQVGWRWNAPTLAKRNNILVSNMIKVSSILIFDCTHSLPSRSCSWLLAAQPARSTHACPPPQRCPLQVDMVLSSPWCWRARPPLPLENSAAGSSSKGGNGAASGAAGQQPQDALGARGGEASSSSSSSSAGPLGGGGGGSGTGAAGKDGVVAPRAWWRRLGRKGGKEADEEGGGAAQVGRGVGTGGEQPQHAAGRAAALASVSAAPQQPGGKGKGGRAGEGEEVWAVGVDTARVKGRSRSEGAASAGLEGSAGQLAAPAAPAASPAAPWDGNPFARLLDALRAPK